MKKEEKNENFKKRNLIAMVLIISAILVSVFAVSFAFFSAGVVGNEEANSVIIRSADLRIIFDSREVIIEDFDLDDSAYKIFTVENTSDHELFYNIEWDDVATESHFFIDGDLLFDIIRENEGSLFTTPRSTPRTNSFILEEVSIASGATHTYRLVISYPRAYPPRDQTANMGASFLGRIRITSHQQIANTN